MADPESIPTKEKGAGGESPQKKGLAGRLMPVLITVAVVIVCAAAGFVVGRLFGTLGSAQTAAAAEDRDKTLVPEELPIGKSENWYYDLESVVANLNEPGASHYVRLGLTLEITGMAEKDGVPFFDQKKPLLKHWLTLFMYNQTLDDLRGEQNLRHLQSQISDIFNQGLFPDSRPRIERVLFKELTIT